MRHLPSWLDPFSHRKSPTGPPLFLLGLASSLPMTTRSLQGQTPRRGDFMHRLVNTRRIYVAPLARGTNIQFFVSFRFRILKRWDTD